MCSLGALCGSASGDVRFFFTSSADAAGLEDTTHIYDDTDVNGTDGSSYELNGTLPTIGVPTVDIDGLLYLWVEFEGEKNGRKIQGINIVINSGAFNGDEEEVARGVYLGDDSADTGELFRWELGSKTSDDITLVAVTTPGIVNRTTNDWLYYGSKNGRRVALLGAINVGWTMTEYHLGIGQNGVSYASNSDGQRAPMVKFGGNDEQFDGNVQDQEGFRWSSNADAHGYVPEPGSLFLIAAAALLIRRR